MVQDWLNTDMSTNRDEIDLRSVQIHPETHFEGYFARDNNRREIRK